MKKRMMVLAATLCCIMTSTVAIAQNDVDEVLKQVEQKVKLADKEQTDGKLQLQAARALVRDDLGERRDPDRALIYANRALKIAEAQTVLKDTLKGHTYLTLGGIYFGKRDLGKAIDCYEKGLEYIGQELGRYDRWTIYNKICIGNFIMTSLDIRRGSLIVQQAFLDSEMTPEDQRIQNISELSFLYELSIEYLMADIANRMQCGLPLLFYEGKRYLVLETDTWNMEQPIVGWLMPSIMNMLQGKNKEEKSKMILCDYYDENAPLRLIEPVGNDRPQVFAGFAINPTDHRYLSVHENNTFLLFFPESTINKILERYHAFKAEIEKNK